MKSFINICLSHTPGLGSEEFWDGRGPEADAKDERGAGWSSDKIKLCGNGVADDGEERESKFISGKLVQPVVYVKPFWWKIV